MRLSDITVTREPEWAMVRSAYIRFEPHRDVASTIEYRLGVNIDLDANGDIVGIEVLG